MIRPKPTLAPPVTAEAFIGANAAAAAEGIEAPADVRIVKSIRILRQLDQALKRAALEQSVARGARVTEQEMLEQILRQHFKL